GGGRHPGRSRTRSPASPTRGPLTWPAHPSSNWPHSASWPSDSGGPSAANPRPARPAHAPPSPSPIQPPPLPPPPTPPPPLRPHPGVDAALAAAVPGRAVQVVPPSKDCMVLAYLPDWNFGNVDNLGVGNNDGGVRTLLDWPPLAPELTRPQNRRFYLALYARE